MGSMHRRAGRRKQYREESADRRTAAEIRAALGDVLPSFAEFGTWPEPYEAETAAVAVLAPALVDASAGTLAGLVRAAAGQAADGTAAFLALVAGLGRRHPAVARAAASALAEFEDAGAAMPSWAPIATAPLRVTGCRQVVHPALPVTVAIADWERAGFAETAVFMDSPLGFGVTLGPAGAEREFLESLRVESRQYGIAIETEPVAPGRLRALVEEPLREQLEEALADFAELDPETEEEELGDFLWSVVAYARLAEFPVPTAQEADEAEVTRESIGLPDLSGLAGFADLGPPEPPVVERTGPAPVLRLRIDLRGAKPPIWRRLEIRGDASLAELHECIQSLFGWGGWHLHRFETEYGDYADPGQNFEDDRYRDATSLALDQVLHHVGDRLLYEYDFGDSHEHVIRLEAVEAAREDSAYPRCPAGRRQAPAEDTGGFGLWAEQISALEDPKHPHHGEALAWLGLEGDDPDSDERRDHLVRHLTAKFDKTAADKALRG